MTFPAPRPAAAAATGGFTLVMTLSILAAVTILVVGLFSIVARERQTSSSFDAVEQAELAVQAGLENAGALLKEALQDEKGLILSVPVADWITPQDVQADPRNELQDESDKQPAAALMAVKREENPASLNGYLWTYTPLASGVLGSKAQAGQADPTLQLLSQDIRPKMPGGYVGGQPTYRLSPVNSNQDAGHLSALKRAAQRAATAVSPWQRTAPGYWVELPRPQTAADPPDDGEGEIAARFAFYVEDLQGGLPLAAAGNFNPDTGLHERTPFAFPANIPSALQERERQLLRWSGVRVPGMNLRRPELPLLAEASLHTLFQPPFEPSPDNADLDDVLTRMHRVLHRGRHLQFSPGNWRETLLQPDPLLGWEGLQASALEDRDAASGSLTHPVMRRIEEQTAAGILPYDELALIPPDPAFASLFIPDFGPARKLNLNRQLYEIETETDEELRQQKARAAVDQIAQHIQTHLPHFAGVLTTTSNPNQIGRKGGYPLPLGGTIQQKALAYVKALAAGIIDYADTDSLPTMDGDPMHDPANDNGGSGAWDARYPRYRGMDAYPVVTKQWQRYRLEESAGGTAVYSITHYLELWNMSNQVISGEISAAYEANGSVSAGFRTYHLMQSLDSLGVVEGAGKPAKGELPDLRRKTKALDGWWHKPIRMDDPAAPDADQRSLAFIKRGDEPPVFKPMRPNEVRVIAFTPVVYRFDIGSTSGSSASLTFSGDDAGSDLRSRYRIAFKPTGASGFVVVDQPLRPPDRLNRNVTDSAKQRFNLGLPGMSYGRNGNYINGIGDPRGAFFVNFHQDYVNYENGSSPWARTVRYNIQEKEYGQTRVHLWPDGGHISRGPKNSAITLDTNPDDKALVPAWHAAKESNVPERQKYVQHLSNAGRFFSVTELGHVFDPIMWDPNGGSEFSSSGSANNNFYRDFANLRTGANATPSDKFCGGNTLRIGRPEHERFRPDYNTPPASGRPFLRTQCATALLDLFHCGQPRAGWHPNPLTPEDLARLTGDFIRIHGHINLNTASRDTLRALAAGRLQMDPRLRRKLTSENQAEQNPTANESVLHPPASAANSPPADLLAELIIRNRPYLTPAELPEKILVPTPQELTANPLPLGMTPHGSQPGVVLEAGQPVFGATRRETDRLIEPEWNDAAAEEAFARIFNSSTVRSRNFKVVVTGQSLRRTRSGETQILATRSKVYHVFIRPIRDATGNIIRQQTEIHYARSL